MTFVVARLAFFNFNGRVRFCGFWLIDDSRLRSRTSKSSTHNPTPRPHAGVSPKTVQENHVRSLPRLVVVDLLPEDFGDLLGRPGRADPAPAPWARARSATRLIQ